MGTPPEENGRTDLSQVAQSCSIAHTITVDNLEDLASVLTTAMSEDGPWFIVAKIEEAEYMPVAPIEPELTLYRMRDSFSG